MARKVRKPTCKICGLVPARRGKNTTWCAKCFAGKGRPKKFCPSCTADWPVDAFVGRRCKSCVSRITHAKRVKDTYGLEDGQYEALLEAQEGRCAICRNRPRTARLAVDHNHDTGEVRGLLCKRCNKNLLGSAHDSTDLLERAIRYLRRPPAREVLGVVVEPDGVPPIQDTEEEADQHDDPTV